MLILVGLVGAPSMGHGQSTTGTAPDLRTRLHERFDVVALQQGVALVPLQSTSTVRMIQIVSGIVTVDGESLTGQQLRDRLGADSDLVLQASYLDVQRQRELADGTAAAPPAPAIQTPEDTARAQVTTGDMVRFGGDVSVGQNERIQGDVVALGGAVDVQGEVTGDLVAIGGAVTLGPQSVVRGDLNVVGGGLTRAPGARVMGSVHEVGGGAAGFGRGRRWSNGLGSFWPRFGSLAATIFRMTLLVLLGLIAVAFAKRPLERIATRTAATPVRAGLVGLLAEILFLPVLILMIVVLAVSIVGIPLLALVPFAVLLMMLVMLVGFIALGYQIGQRLTARLGWTERGDYLAVAIGILAIGCLTVLAKLAALAGGSLIGVPLTAFGYVVEYVAWTVGFGATIMVIHETQKRGGSHTPGGSPAATDISPA
ncbi:MAG: polymer-forming cytoskeletal protein [Acidobacteria bacterium]|nr:polymer-forming cytoskeletal protein [Acidobacteriota bacterium]